MDTKEYVDLVRKVCLLPLPSLLCLGAHDLPFAVLSGAGHITRGAIRLLHQQGCGSQQGKGLVLLLLCVALCCLSFVSPIVSKDHMAHQDRHRALWIAPTLCEPLRSLGHALRRRRLTDREEKPQIKGSMILTKAEEKNTKMQEILDILLHRNSELQV